MWLPIIPLIENEPRLNQTLIALVAVLANYTLLYSRKKKWAVSIYRWIIVVIYALIGVALFYLDQKETLNLEFFLIWSFYTPLIFSCVDKCVKFLSILFHHRDLNLWIQHSDDIFNAKVYGDKKFKASDKFFSMILVMLILFLPVSFILIV